MKKVCLFILILHSSLGYASNIILQDTIKLNEVNLFGKSYEKIKKIKTKGKKKVTISSIVNGIILSPIPIDECVNLASISIKIDEESITNNETIQLVFYDIDEFGYPNNELSAGVLVFNTINKANLNIDVSSLNYTFCDTFFVGFKKINKTNFNEDERIKFKAKKKKGNATYFKTEKTEKWDLLENYSLDIEVYYH